MYTTALMKILCINNTRNILITHFLNPKNFTECASMMEVQALMVMLGVFSLVKTKNPLSTEPMKKMLRAHLAVSPISEPDQIKANL